MKSPENRRSEDEKENIDEISAIITPAPSQEVPRADTEMNAGEAVKEKEVMPTVERKEPAQESGANLSAEDEAGRIKAVEILSDPNVMDRTPKELEEAFLALTGKDLSVEADKIAQKNLNARGAHLIKGKDAVEKYRMEVFVEETRKFLRERNSMAIETLSKRKHGTFGDEDILALAEKAKKTLGLKGENGDIAFAQLVNGGLKPEESKFGFLGSIQRMVAGDGPIKIPREETVTEGSSYAKFPSTKSILENVTAQARREAAAEAELRAHNKIIEGRQRLVRERLACSKDLIEKAVADFNLKKQQEQAAVAEAERNNRIISEAEIKKVTSFDELFSLLSVGGKILGKQHEIGPQRVHEAKDQKKAIEEIFSLVQDFIEQGVVDLVGRFKNKSTAMREIFSEVTSGSGLREKVNELVLEMVSAAEKKEEAPPKKTRTKSGPRKAVTIKSE